MLLHRAVLAGKPGSPAKTVRSIIRNKNVT